MIEDYRFGTYTFEGVQYTEDAIIHRGQIRSWWRKRGHSVAAEDIAGLLAEQPTAIVIGTGAYGIMQVPAETRRLIEEHGIALTIAKTGKAVAAFNRLLEAGSDVAIAMHLTC